MVIRKYKNNFLLTYDDGDYIFETNSFITCLNKAKSMKENGEDIIRIRCMRIYTSNYKKGGRGTVEISIAGRCLDNYTGLEYKKLAPKFGFWKEWEKTKNNDYYIQHYYDEVLSHLNPEQVLLELAELSNGKDISLLCYEEYGEFCHRFLVADWLNENLTYNWLDVVELDYDEIGSLIKKFKKNFTYDETDELVFESEAFETEMKYNLIPKEDFHSEEEYLNYAMKIVIQSLNYCEYGECMNKEEEIEREEDLKYRGFFNRV